MTKLLERAFDEASKLPNVEQNALAKWLLGELEAERKWEKTLMPLMSSMVSPSYNSAPPPFLDSP